MARPPRWRRAARRRGAGRDLKTPWLDRLKADGVFLIDLVPYPVNKLSLDKAEAG
jgi:hypothetical protein